MVYKELSLEDLERKTISLDISQHDYVNEIVLCKDSFESFENIKITGNCIVVSSAKTDITGIQGAVNGQGK